MTPRVLSVTGHERREVAGWRICATPPDAAASPDALERLGARWLEAAAPTTAGAALRAAGALDLGAGARRLDGEDWWFRAALPSVDREPGDELALCLDGLATLADVWLDGEPLLTSDNMFRRHERPLAAGGGDLWVRCRSLDAALAARRPRPRWRAPMVEHQQLRWFRTTLLGRTPGWSPPVPPVGPWRPVAVERRARVAVDEVRLRVRAGEGGAAVELAARLRGLGGPPPGPAALVVSRGGDEHRAPLELGDGGVRGALALAAPARWWPHTHGEPALYDARLELGDVTVALGRVGFRELERRAPFELVVNGAPVFCRGACFTPLDPIALAAARDATAAALDQVCAAGMNMLRVSGAMVYEGDDLHDLCDERGVLVWQDLMFANLDYPEDDPAFVAGVAEEVTQALARLQARPSLAVVCGSSEGEQQAAMFGAGRDRWSPRLFHEVLPAIAADLCPDVPYWPSSAHGGDFPHQASSGTTSYYGVGAYLLPLEDARRAEVRFATECLAFANVPGPRALPGGPSARVHHPAWKARTPRDLGAGWDFDDVRDHYLAAVYGVEPARLRYAEHDRYLELGRVVTGEVMAAVFGEWRRRRSTCRGGLVWFLRDLWPGAGWGLLDSEGRPKAAWHLLARALQPVALHLSDEGVNGVTVHVVNDRPEPLSATLELDLYRSGEVPVGGARRELRVEAREAVELGAASLLDGFVDLAYVYRFGPPPCDLVVAGLRDEAGALLSRAFHFPLGRSAAREADLGLSARAQPDEDGAGATLVLRTRRFAEALAFDLEGFEPEDAYFHLAPGEERALRLRRVSGQGPPRGTVQPLNAQAATRVVAA